MRSRALCFLALPALVFALAALPGRAQPPKGDPKDMEAIAKNGETFIEAFHKGDAKALAAFWTADGDFTDEAGHHLKGREAIEKDFEAYFAENKDLKLRINSNALRFVTPDVAIEDGTSETIHSDGGPPTRVRYTIVHVQKDGKWLLASVRNALFVPATNYTNLRDLEWTIGDWADDAAGGESIHKSFAWSENQGFIVGTFSTSFKHTTLSGGTQWIGWDPAEKRVRSWIFDTNGGFGEGAWSRDGNKWVIKTSVIQQDGKKATATITFTRIDAETMSWQAQERTLDGKPLPDIKETKLKRLK
jgi:uncharacterized protein (TIGR02246 family)